MNIVCIKLYLQTLQVPEHLRYQTNICGFDSEALKYFYFTFLLSFVLQCNLCDVELEIEKVDEERKWERWRERAPVPLESGPLTVKQCWQHLALTLSPSCRYSPLIPLGTRHHGVATPIHTYTLSAPRLTLPRRPPGCILTPILGRACPPCRGPGQTSCL